MNEFIVWDNVFNIFREELPFNFCVDIDGKIKIFENKNIIRESKDMYLYKYIGKKDINNKKIYADCSIVEFLDYKKEKFIGYFQYSEIKLAYEIVVLNYDSDFVPIITYCKDDIANIKIIDTIQENKSGLIKAK